MGDWYLVRSRAFKGFELCGSIRMYLNPSSSLYPHLGFNLGWCGWFASVQALPLRMMACTGVRTSVWGSLGLVGLILVVRKLADGFEQFDDIKEMISMISIDHCRMMMISKITFTLVERAVSLVARSNFLIRAQSTLLYSKIIYFVVVDRRRRHAPLL
jgi:hypothetical protein